MIYFGTNQSEIDQIQELDKKTSRTLEIFILICLPDNSLLPANMGSDRLENRNRHPYPPLK